MMMTTYTNQTVIKQSHQVKELWITCIYNSRYYSATCTLQHTLHEKRRSRRTRILLCLWTWSLVTAKTHNEILIWCNTNGKAKSKPCGLFHARSRSHSLFIGIDW